MTVLRVLAALVIGLWLAGCTSSVLAPVDSRGYVGGGHGGYYTVRRGDTLYSIAWRHDADFRSVARWNRIEPPYVIYPGQKLRLSPPSASQQQASAPAPSSVSRKSSPSVKNARPAPTSPQRSQASAADLAAPSWRWPVEGKIVKRFSSNGDGKQGIEIAGSDGASIAAAAPGRVVYAGSGLRGYGNLIIIKHNSRYLTAYGYNRQLLVKEGDSVSAGQRIATMGRSGGDSQARLHFELRRDGKAVDPLSYLPGR